MNKDILVKEPVTRDEEDDSLIEKIERELRELDKKKKSDMEKEKLQQEIELIETHIKTALQMQKITFALAAQYRDELKKASIDKNAVKTEKKYFRLNELPGMIEERRRQRKIKEETEKIMKKIKENPDYVPTIQEYDTLNAWKREEIDSQHVEKEKNNEYQEKEKGK